MPNVLEAGSRKAIAAPVADSPILEESKYFVASVDGDILYVLELYSQNPIELFHKNVRDVEIVRLRGKECHT